MGSRIENRVVLGSLRYKSASDTNLLFQLPLTQTAKENVEFDRTISVQLSQVYDNERQSSTLFRPMCKLSLIFENKYTGRTGYYPYKSSLYYENIKGTADLACSNDPNVSDVKYSGFPQYYEFDFMRVDNNISGYTIPDVDNKYHVNFANKSATTYNWSLYMSYAYNNNYSQQMSAIDIKTQTTMNWVASDGIPFVVNRSTDQSQLIISFRCPMSHGLSVGDYVKLSFKYNNNNDLFQVYSLGDSFYGNEEFIFNIYDVGYLGNTFNNGVTGTFKRISDINNSGDTTSEYYVRQHKILTEENYAVLTKTGFEQQIFNKVKKREKGSITPNNQTRISLKESNTVYNLSFNEDIDIGSLKDNLTRPLTELYFTVIWKGFMGWTMGIGDYGVQKGWGFNIPPSTISNDVPSPWWNYSNSDSLNNFQLTRYTTTESLKTNPARYFQYVKPFKVGTIIDGDYCEWNKSEQKERVISDLYHKFKYNPYFFNIGVTQDLPFGNSNKGYYYKPLYPVTIRTYSDYIEEGDPKTVDGIPDYAIFSNKTNTFVWRDIYPYGYIDTSNIGVDYPFLNGRHYPYTDIKFKLFGEGSDYINNINNSVVSDPTTDNCE